MERLRGFLKHFFIPHEKNNYRARVLHHDFLTYYLVLVMIFVFSLKHFSLNNNILGFATDITINKLLSLTNEERIKNNLEPLSFNTKLSTAAEKKGQDMFTKNYWSHYSPDGKTPWDFILDSGYQYEYAGENLAKNFLISKSVVEAWMNSPSHRENLLRKDYADVGFAIVNGVLNGEETTLVVQEFGKPLNNPLLTQNKIATTNPVVNKESVLAKQSTRPKYNLFNISFDITYIFIIFLALVLLIDFYVVSKMNIVRVNGKNIAHFIFLAFIIIGLSFIIAKSGIVL